MKLAIKSGAIIPVLLVLPNLAWMLFYSLDAGAKSDVPVALSACGGPVPTRHRAACCCKRLVARSNTRKPGTACRC